MNKLQETAGLESLPCCSFCSSCYSICHTLVSIRVIGKNSKNDNYEPIMIHRSFVHESVRWLAERGKSERCIKILKKIAKTNGKEVQQEIYDSYEVRGIILKKSTMQILKGTLLQSCLSMSNMRQPKIFQFPNCQMHLGLLDCDKQCFLLHLCSKWRKE